MKQGPLLKSLKQTMNEKIWRKHHYEALTVLPESEHRDPRCEQTSEHVPTWRRRIIFAGAVILLLVLALVSLSATKLQRQSRSYDQCGTSPAEARARGCFFEMTLSLWVPEECYDRELEAEYLNEPGLVYYRDLNFTQEVPFDEVKRGEVYAWFVPWQHHIRHCAYSFRKFHRASARNSKLDGYLLNYNHTMHCIMMMTEPSDVLAKLPQRDVRMYPYCGRKGGFNVDKTRRFQWTD